MAGSTLRSGGSAACTGISTSTALKQPAMNSRPSHPSRSWSAAPTAAGASGLPEVLWRSTWLAGLAIPFTLAHPKNRTALYADARAAPHTRLDDSLDTYDEKLSRPLVSGALLPSSGCNGSKWRAGVADHPQPHDAEPVSMARVSGDVDNLTCLAVLAAPSRRGTSAGYEGADDPIGASRLGSAHGPCASAMRWASVRGSAAFVSRPD